jgi:hypothetical protein
MKYSYRGIGNNAPMYEHEVDGAGVHDQFAQVQLNNKRKLTIGEGNSVPVQPAYWSHKNQPNEAREYFPGETLAPFANDQSFPVISGSGAAAGTTISGEMF